VKSYTHDWLAHSYNPPFMYGNVAFEGGATVMMEFVEFEPDELVVGAPVKMAFRIKDQDFERGYHRYFWKAALIPESK
jgi:hydroxymethylglutaryl-CoA synthase